MSTHDAQNGPDQAPPPRATASLAGRVSFPVYYEDTDFSGYVYHANFLKFFERAREELIGLVYLRELYQRGVHFVVAHVELAFHAPARHADTVTVLTKMQLSASPVCLVEQTAEVTPGRPCVTGTIKLVAVNSNGEPRRLPADILARFQELASLGRA